MRNSIKMRGSSVLLLLGTTMAPIFAQTKEAAQPLSTNTINCLAAGSQLKQIFSLDPLEKDLTIKLEVQNISPFTIFLSGITRYFDADVDNSASGDIYDRTGDSVMGREVNGLSLTAVSDLPVTSVHPFSSNGWNTCSLAGVATPTAAGDFTGRVYLPFGYHLAPGKFESATFVYRRN